MEPVQLILGVELQSHDVDEVDEVVNGEVFTVRRSLVL